MSDTHDAEDMLAIAAGFFRQRGVDLVLHLGDVTQPETLDALDGLPLQVLRGNNDEHAWAETWRAEIAGVTLFAAHGHRRPLLESVLGHVDVALHGHTHARRRELVGGTLVVNPGALYRATTKSVALLELPTKRVSFFRVAEDGVAPMHHG